MELDMDIRGDESHGVCSSGSERVKHEAGAGGGDGGRRPSSAAGTTARTVRSKRMALAPPALQEPVADPPATGASSAGDKDTSATAAPAQKRGKQEPKARASSRQQRAPVPPQQLRTPVSLSATREKLAAIFRLRLQQRQQLEELVGGGAAAGGAAPLQCEATQVAGAGTSESPPLSVQHPRALCSARAVSPAVSDDASIHYHHAQQLQQYYYQQAMLASSMSMAGASEDASTLSSGIMDPRVIQARMDALELQRRIQQQQLHDYYYQHMATARARNRHELAVSQQFLAKSSKTWQQQQQQGSQDGSSSRSSDEDAEAGHLESQSSAPADMSALEAKLRTGAAITSPLSAAAASQDLATSSLARAPLGSEAKPSNGTTRAGTNSAGQDTCGAEGTREGCGSGSRVASEDKGSVLYEFVL